MILRCCLVVGLIQALLGSSLGQVRAALVPVPDPAFRQFLISSPDFGSCMVPIGPDTLLDTDCAAVQTAPMLCASLGIQSLQGIEHFVALTVLECNNNQLTTLNLSSNIQLRKLNAMHNQLTQLVLPLTPTLEYLWVSYNPLGAVNTSGYPELKQLWCHDTQLTQLDVSSNPKLEELRCPHNYLTTLNLTQNPNLTWFSCINNQLTTLNLSANIRLKYVACTANNLTAFENSLPDSLCTLLVLGNPVSCLPNIPQGLGCASGFYCDIGLVQCPGATISGRVYIDHNQSGVFDAGDAPLGNHPVQATLNGTLIQVNTNPMGTYELVTPQAGTVRVQVPVPAGGLAQEPLNWDTTFDVLANTSYALSFRLAVDPVWKDLSLVPLPPVPGCVGRGQTWACAVRVTNNTLASTVPHLRCSYSPGLEWAETAIPNATVVQHDTLSRTLDLQLNSLPSGGMDSLTVGFRVSGLASQVQVVVQTLEPEPPEAGSDNIASFATRVCTEVVEARADWHRAILLPEQPDTRYYFRLDTLFRTFTYRNIGLAPIQTLLLTDTLPNDLMEAEVELVEASPAVSMLRPSPNVVQFRLEGSLPDSMTVPGGHVGSITYRLQVPETIPCNSIWRSRASAGTADTFLQITSPNLASLNPRPAVRIELLDVAWPQVTARAQASAFADSIVWLVEAPYQQALGPGPHTFSFDGTSQGVIQVKAFQGECFTVSSTYTSVNEQSSFVRRLQIRTYPNPAAELLVVEGIDPTTTVLPELWDMGGHRLRPTIRMESASGSAVLHVDLTNIPPGLYFLQVGAARIPVVKH
jgi:hypothetical protein